MNRRDGILAIAALGSIPHAARAQQGNRMPVIGFLHSGSAGTVQRPSTTLQALREGLESQGYFEGKNVRIEARFAEGKPERSAALAQELARLKVDLIVAVGPSSVKAASASSKDLPIVAQDLETDPVAGGLISILAKSIAGALATQRIPCISPFRAFAEHGGPLSYGANLPVMYRGMANFVDKILRGAKPGELPIEQPTHFELVINLQTAKTLGLTIPHSLLVRADDVIR